MADSITNQESVLPDLNPHIFRAYDIRGLDQRDLTVEVARLIGQAYGTYIQRLDGPRIVVGRDNRLSSEALQQAFIAGAASSGCHVTDIGLSLSPVLYFAVNQWGADGGANITGSHNPKGHNGFKMTRRRAVPISGEEIQVLRRMIGDFDFAGGAGSTRQRPILDEYVAERSEQLGFETDLKVVVDAGNGTAGLYAPPLLRNLGCSVTELYCELDGNFPNHLPDPEMEENTEDLQRLVKEEGADLGLAYDGDGDRVGFVDEQGQRYESDLLLMLLARDFLSRRPGERVLLDVKCSQVVIDDIRKNGGIPVLWKSGHSLIKKKMLADGIDLGGEISGHMFFRLGSAVYDDALLASCHLLHIASTGGALSRQLADLPKTCSTPELKVSCPDAEKFGVVEEVAKHFKQLYPDSVTIDGIRIQFDEGWALVRASNTSTYLTLRFESATEQGLEKIKRIVRDKLAQFKSVEQDVF